MNQKYEARQELRPRNLEGIGEDQIAQHWALYEGYVKNVNALNESVSALVQKKDFGLQFSELKRRLGFEYDGMILHELYFGVLKSGQKPLGDFSELTKLMKKCFGGFEAWREEFKAIGRMRGVGWAILYYDPRADVLTNNWVEMHEQGHPIGFEPVLVMDLWEHAYMVDGGADRRPRYVDAFLQNVDWPKVEQVLVEAKRATAARPEKQTAKR